MKIKNYITNGVICMLIVANVFVSAMIVHSIKPKCIVDGCNVIRCEKSFYCHEHAGIPKIEVKVCYGKR
ncbi:MAG: hypothetical protein Q4E51_07030 [Lachnospiraceae bacterium]|nr:hypothetical protein [Lachnospiraceae bacterium]